MLIWRTRVVAVFLSVVLAANAGISARSEEVTPILGEPCISQYSTTSMNEQPLVFSEAITETQTTTEVITTPSTTTEVSLLPVTSETTEAVEVTLIETNFVESEEIEHVSKQEEVADVTQSNVNFLHYEISSSDVEALAKLCAGESGHLPDEEHRYVIWTVFNRVDEGRWGGNTIQGVINCPNQFVGKHGGVNWSTGSDEYKEYLRQLVAEEYQKWANGECCPACAYNKTESSIHGYNSFTGDGHHNWFGRVE